MDSTHPFLSLFKISLQIHHLNNWSDQKFGLTIVQWILLRQLIQMPGVSAQMLAKAVGVHPSTLTQTLKRLKRKGCIFMINHPKDSRKRIISATRQGKQLLDSIEPQMERFFKNIERSVAPLAEAHDYLAYLIHTPVDHSLNRERLK